MPIILGGPPPPAVFKGDTQMCAYFRKLDVRFKTPSGSPLHHDWRCPIHGSDPRHRRPT